MVRVHQERYENEGLAREHAGLPTTPF